MKTEDELARRIEIEKNKLFALYKNQNIHNYNLDILNYGFNGKSVASMSLNEYINGQTISPYNLYQLEYRTNGYNTCGAIAIYNLNVMMGHNKDRFGMVVSELNNETGALLAFGNLGVNWETIPDYYSEKGITVDEYSNVYFKQSTGEYSNIDTVISDSKGGIILYAHAEEKGNEFEIENWAKLINGGHSIAVEEKMTENGKMYVLYNEAYKTEYTVQSIDEYLKNEGKTFLVMWVVDK